MRIIERIAIVKSSNGGICTLKDTFWSRHFWARGYIAISSGNITDEMIQQYIDEQEGEPVR